MFGEAAGEKKRSAITWVAHTSTHSCFWTGGNSSSSATCESQEQRTAPAPRLQQPHNEQQDAWPQDCRIAKLWPTLERTNSSQNSYFYFYCELQLLTKELKLPVKQHPSINLILITFLLVSYRCPYAVWYVSQGFLYHSQGDRFLRLSLNKRSSQRKLCFCSTIGQLF